MSELDSVVDLGLPEPRLFIPGGEDLHGHALSHPGAPPHLSIPPFTLFGEQHNDNVTIIRLFLIVYIQRRRQPPFFTGPRQSLQCPGKIPVIIIK